MDKGTKRKYVRRQPDFAQNRISEVAKGRGFKKLKPDDSILESLGIKIHTWNKWFDKKLDPSFGQTIIIAKEILHCEPGDLFPSLEKSDETIIANRHNLVPVQ